LKAAAPDAIEEQELLADQGGASGEHSGGTLTEPAPAEAHAYEVKDVIDQPSNVDSLAEPVVRPNEVPVEFASEEPQLQGESRPLESASLESEKAASDEEESDEPEGDASASHHIEPLPPSGFSFFRTRREEEVRNTNPCSGHDGDQAGHGVDRFRLCSRAWSD